MNDLGESNSKDSLFVHTCSTFFLMGGIVLFQAVASSIANSPERGLNYQRIIAAGAVGAGSALIGYAIAKAIERIRG